MLNKKNRERGIHLATSATCRAVQAKRKHMISSTSTINKEQSKQNRLCAQAEFNRKYMNLISKFRTPSLLTVCSPKY